MAGDAKFIVPVAGNRWNSVGDRNLSQLDICTAISISSFDCPFHPSYLVYEANRTCCVDEPVNQAIPLPACSLPMLIILKYPTVLSSELFYQQVSLLVTLRFISMLQGTGPVRSKVMYYYRHKRPLPYLHLRHRSTHNTPDMQNTSTTHHVTRNISPPCLKKSGKCIPSV